MKAWASFCECHDSPLLNVSKNTVEHDAVIRKMFTGIIHEVVFVTITESKARRAK